MNVLLLLADENIWCLCLEKEELKNNRIRRRVYELLSKAATSKASHPILDHRELHFTFFCKPDRFLESDDRHEHVSGVHLEKTRLIGKSLFCCYELLASAVLLAMRIDKMQTWWICYSLDYAWGPIKWGTPLKATLNNTVEMIFLFWCLWSCSLIIFSLIMFKTFRGWIRKTDCHWYWRIWGCEVRVILLLL